MSNQHLVGPALPPMMGKSKSVHSDEEDAIIGPALPPLYKAAESSDSCEDSDQEEVVFKRAKYSSRNKSSLNRRGLVKEETCTKQAKKDNDDDGFFGPALPPGYKNLDRSPEGPSVLGPALPPGFKIDAEDEEGGNDDSRGVLGPALPPGYKPDLSSSDEGEDDVIGPMPAKGATQDSVALDFERRAQRMKDKLTGVDTGPEVLARESWMTELPPEMQHVGLSARTFKKRSGPENKDRSIWTDTPADREQKARERLEAKEKGESTKDETPRLSQKELEMAEKVSKYNESKRGESLINMHTKKMKREAEEDAKKPVERRSFDRDMDLQVNRFDEAQKKALLKKSQELNTRFSHSKDRMFL
ncbi:GPALPP motifs-containing protein 1 isoform X1 [Triplophysa dalaica]|uniref:GPALPP motifs-containing protein 1 isoform X1 n=1 Tax=Triplophysa dalaica TaxID=1582913 RepID=UPI0024DFAA9D|nr:GPALPP motifs-containing protein 1 isoform X1 [Triplophysa dalaica]